MGAVSSILSDLISDVVFTPVHVVEAERISSRFTRVRLAGRAFERGNWTPGAKLQLRTQPGTMTLRTYTPVAPFDSSTKTSADLIAYHHGDGPGAHWFDRASTGLQCEVFGPSRSLDLSDSNGEALFIGDETSVALAMALRNVNPGSRLVFEATAPKELSSLLSGLGLSTDVEVVEKSDHRGGLLEHARETVVAYGGQFDIVVSGDAATVNAVRRATRHWTETKPRIKARAYWARGRTGLS